MDASQILANLQRMGLTLTPAGAGNVRVTPKAALTDETRALIQAHKAELLAELGALPGPAAEARRQPVLVMLTERPGVPYAAATDALAVPGSVTLTLAVRGIGTVELIIPAEKWDGVLFLDLLDRHGATVH